MDYVREDSAIRLAVVDMAGTIVREDGLVLDAVEGALHSVDARPADLAERFRRSRGTSKLSMLTELLDGDRERGQVAHQRFEEELIAGVSRGRVTPIPGAQRALEHLQDRGIRVALITGFSRHVRDHLLKHLGWLELVNLVLSPEDAGRGRPYPDLPLTALLQLEIESVAQLAVVGDTVNDLLAGHRAGAAVVAAVLSGAHGPDEFETVPHTHVLSDMSEFPAIVGAA